MAKSYALTITSPHDALGNRDYLAIDDTETAQLFDAILSHQNYRNHDDYTRTYASSGELRDQITALLSNKNESYLKLIAFVTTNILASISEAPDVFADAGNSDDQIAFWETIAARHQDANGEIDKKYRVDELLEIEDDIADEDGSLNGLHFLIGYRYLGDDLFYLFKTVNTLRRDYQNTNNLNGLVELTFEFN